MNGSYPSFDMFSFWAEWARSVLNLWHSTSTWQDIFTISKGREQRRMEEYQKNAFGAWNSMWSHLFDPAVIKELQGAATMTELAVAGARSLVDGCMQFQEWAKSLGDQSLTGRKSFFTQAQQEVFNAWVDFQQAEIQPLLRIPQAG